MAIGMLLAALLAQDLAVVTADAADPVAVATRLDITSFPNSIGPRRKEGLRTFADYDFTSVVRDGNAAVLDAADKSWTFRSVSSIAATGR